MHPHLHNARNTVHLSARRFQIYEIDFIKAQYNSKAFKIFITNLQLSQKLINFVIEETINI